MHLYHWIILVSCSTVVSSLSCYEREGNVRVLKECLDTVRYCYRLDGTFYGVRGVDFGCAESFYGPVCESDGCREESGSLPQFRMFKGTFCCCSKDGCNGAAAFGASALLFAALFSIFQLL